MADISKIKMFEFGDDTKDWIAAETKKDAIQEYSDMTDYDETVPVRVLSEKEVDTFKVFLEEPEWCDEKDDWKDTKSMSFREWIQDHADSGYKFPTVVACSEW